MSHLVVYSVLCGLFWVREVCPGILKKMLDLFLSSVVVFRDVV